MELEMTRRRNVDHESLQSTFIEAESKNLLQPRISLETAVLKVKKINYSPHVLCVCFRTGPGLRAEVQHAEGEAHWAGGQPRWTAPQGTNSRPAPRCLLSLTLQHLALIVFAVRTERRHCEDAVGNPADPGGCGEDQNAAVLRGGADQTGGGSEGWFWFSGAQLDVSYRFLTSSCCFCSWRSRNLRWRGWKEKWRRRWQRWLGSKRLFRAVRWWAGFWDKLLIVVFSLWTFPPSSLLVLFFFFFCQTSLQMNSSMTALQAEKERLLRSVSEKEAELSSLRQTSQLQQSSLQQERDRSSRELGELQGKLKEKVSLDGCWSQTLQCKPVYSLI